MRTTTASAFSSSTKLDTSYGDVIIDGLSITGGNATTAVAGTDTGGGVFIESTTHVTVTIQNCKIYDNTAEDGSGGIWSYNSDYMQVIGCEIYDNEGHGVAVSHGSNPAVIDNVGEKQHGIRDRSVHRSGRPYGNPWQ